MGCKRSSTSLNCPGQSDSIVPTGATFYSVESAGSPRSFSFLLLPEFTLLAFSSAVDPLRIANQLAQKALYHWDVLSDNGLPVRSSSGIEVGVDRALVEVAANAHIMVCSGNHGCSAASVATLATLRKHDRFGGMLGGICTGATTLARAGLLGKRKFTLHWENQPAFAEAFPDLSPSSHRFETNGSLLTCGGGAAATDMMLWVIAQDFGEDFAITVADMCLRGTGFEPRPEQRSSLAVAISSRNPRIIKVVREMHQNIETPLSLEAIAHKVGYSRRQIERQFKQVLGETPGMHYRNIRLNRAHGLFAETDMTVMEIAVACGFSSGSGFSGHYRKRFGKSPNAFKNCSQKNHSPNTQ